MNEIHLALADSVRQACMRSSGIEEVEKIPAGHWNQELWEQLDRIGVTAISVPEESGGSGGDLMTATAVLEVLGQYSAAVPLVETALLAGWLTTAAGGRARIGPASACDGTGHVDVARSADGFTVRGKVARVPWARIAESLVMVVDDQVVVLEPSDYRLTRHTNLAGEPRDDVLVEAVVPVGRVTAMAPEAGTRELFQRRAALGRAALMVGAARTALDLAISYAGAREQFGRPIGRFQAVQHHLASMTAEVLLARVGVQAAAEELDASGSAEFEVASAKAVAGQMAGIVAASAHQVHGAIGLTEEHALRHSSTRLWAWRDENGNEREWAAVAGSHALAGEGERLWPTLVGGIR